MVQRLIRLPLVFICVLSVSSFAMAQGGATSSLAGTVVDEQGGAMPGASVTITNVATGEKFDTVTNETGTFLVPALPVGTYSVTVSIDGFKTAVLEDVVLNAGIPASVRATLQIGTLQETVVVSGAGSIVQTQSTAVATTMDVNQIGNLPLVSRNTLDFIVFLPGVNTPGGNRDSTVNGLPQSTINITVDGMNVQDNYLKTTDGFFARMSPRLDAVEEVTVSSAAQGAEAAGQGAVQIRYVTRSGSNNFAGSVYWYYRNDSLNANTWFNERDNLPKPELLQNQVGFRVGGPIVIPGLYDGRSKAFYFVNYEEYRQPQTIRRDRTILTPEAQAGLFRYNTSSGVRTVDLFALAAANGQLATFDPVVSNILAEIRSSTSGAGSITDLDDPNLQRFSWNVNQRSHNRYPTGRIDYNLTDNHRLTGSINYQKIQSLPDTLNSRDPYFPGFAVQGNQISHRYTWSTTLRSTLGSNLVNEFRVGGTGGPTYFSNELNAGMYDNQAGYYLNIGTANITNAGGNATPSSREASTKVVENTVNWLKGNHSFNFGGSFTQADVWARNQNLVPEIRFDVVTGDPADSLFTSSNFPGSSSTNRNDAGDLYAVLTGRVSNINANAAYDSAQGKFVYLAERLQQGQLRDFGFHAQDSWRVRPDLTVNFGLRWELQLPFHPLNDSYSNSTYEDVWGLSGLASSCTNLSDITPGNCNLFKPGVQPGKAVTEYIPFKKGEYGYNIDWNNVAPSAGVAWTPSADEGWLRSFLGSPGDTVFRAGYARAYNRPGMSDFTGRYDDNPGILITTNRSLSDGNLGTPLPLLLRESSRLFPPAFNETREYPMTDVATGDVTIFDKDIQIPSADTWSFGYQRAVSKNMAVEARYVGTRSRDGWVNYNINELNIVENGFLDEFKLAQQNLQANIAAGRGANFRYYGAGTGTAPLPTFLAYFSGRTDATNASAYTSSNFSSSTFVNPLAIYNPQPYTAANALDADATRRANALRANLPANFLVANPDKLGGARFAGNGGGTKYHSLQLELRRRMADGLQFQTSYVYGRAYEEAFYSFRKPWVSQRDSGGEGGVTHAFKANWVYELPFGQGRRFGANVGGALDRLVGGWQIHGTARFQSGRMVDFGNVRLVGFSTKDLQNMYKVRIDQDQFVWMLPQDVIDNTVKAFSVSATSPTGYSELGVPEGRYFAPANGPDCIELAQVDGDTGYGDCGARSVVVSGPMFKNVDLSIVKLVPIVGRVRAEFRLELLNAFNWVNYVPVTGFSGGTGSDPTEYEVTALNGAVTSRIIQIVSRVTW